MAEPRIEPCLSDTGAWLLCSHHALPTGKSPGPLKIAHRGGLEGGWSLKRLEGWSEGADPQAQAAKVPRN